MFQMLLGNVLQIGITLNDLCIPGVILDQTQNVGGVDSAVFIAFLLGDDNLNRITDCTS